MSLQASLVTATSGLRHTQRALAAAADNVANADTAGYTRKTVAAEAVVGGGVRSLAATRQVDEALVTELNSRRAAAAAAETRATLLTGIETAYGNPEDADSLGDVTAALRTGFEDLLADPAESGRQTAVLLDAQQVAIRFNEVADAIADARQQAQDGIVTEVAGINATLRQIASLTTRIQSEIALTGGAAALEDQRDAAIATLTQSIEVKALKRDDGGIVLVARNGLVLPLDEKKDAFATADAALDATSFYGSGGTIPAISLGGIDVTSALKGGRLAEYVALRDETLPRYQAEVDLAAATIASRLEAQGLRLFTDAAGSVPDTATAYAGSDMVGFAARMQLGAAVAADPSLLRDGTHDVAGDAAGASAFAVNPDGGPAAFTTLLERIVDYSFGTQAQDGVGWSTVQTGGLGPDGTLSSPFGAPATIEGYTALITATHTADSAAATAAATGSRAVVDGLAARFSRQSGVDVDAEMAAMVTLQNAYAANARVLSTVQSMWDSLLAAVN